VSHYSGWHFFGHNSPAARELFKPSTDSASLLVKMEEKRFLFLVGGLLGGPTTSGGVLETLATFAQPWTPTY